MLLKLIGFIVVVAAYEGCLAAWHGPLAGGLPAHQYPAGVSPQACPNYPHCQNPAVAANPSAPQQHYWGGGAAAHHQWAPQHHGLGLQSALDRGEYTGDGDYRGEGLAESGAYGQYNHGGPVYNAHHHQYGIPAGRPHQLPAGVDPSSCPNYPFCHH